MLKKLLLFLVLPLLGFSQVNTDSLKRVGLGMEQSDKSRINALYQLSQVYVFSKPDSTLFFSNIQYDFSKKIDNKKGMARAAQLQGAALGQKGDFKAALERYEISLEHYKTLQDTFGILSIQNNIGVVYRKQGDVVGALDKYHEILSLIDLYGGAFLKMEPACLGNLGLIYRGIGEFDQAKKYFERVLSLTEDTATFASMYNNLGSIYIEEKKLDSAIIYFNKSLYFFDAEHDKNGYAISLGNLGNVYKRQGDSLRAMESYSMSLKISKEVGNKGTVANILLNMADYYWKYGPLDSALVYAQAALRLANQIGILGMTSKAAQLLHQIYKEKEDSSLALEMYELFISSRDSMTRLEKQKEILRKELATKYKFDLKKQREEDQSSYQQTILILLGLFTLFLLIFFFWVRKKQKKEEEERNSLLQEIERLKEKAVLGMVASSEKQMDLSLDKAKIEAAIQTKLNPTDWNILNLIFDNPSITNKQIATSVSLSYDGASSSLRKMYKLFNIEVKKNHKMALIIKATRISQED